MDFKDLDWSQITSLVIRNDSDGFPSILNGFEFYNSVNQPILKIGKDEGAS